MMSHVGLLDPEALNEKAVEDSIRNIFIDKDLQGLVDFKSEKRNIVTEIFYRYMLLTTKSRTLTELKMVETRLTSLKATMKDVLLNIRFLLDMQCFTAENRLQKLGQLVGELLKWYWYFQKKLEVHLERRENAIDVQDSSCVQIADMPTEEVGEIDEVDNKEDDTYLQVSVNEEVADLLDRDNVADLLEREEVADLFECGEVANLLECVEETVGMANTSDSFAQTSNKLKAEKMLSFSIVLNFDLFLIKCTRSLDGSILLPEFTGMFSLIVLCCSNSGLQPELKIHLCNELSSWPWSVV